MASVSSLLLNPKSKCQITPPIRSTPAYTSAQPHGSRSRRRHRHHPASSFLTCNGFNLHWPSAPTTANWSTSRETIKASWRTVGSQSAVCASRSSFDVVVVGAGIIGLSIARKFLFSSDLSVAVVDGSKPCAGATGAGQGYIWMTHKTPGSDIWDLATRSQHLWHALVNEIEEGGGCPLDQLGWKKTGSLLVGANEKESTVLKNKVEQLSSAGVRAEYLSYSDLIRKEPELAVGSQGCASFLPDDAQLDAHQTVDFIEKGNRLFASEGRYAEFFRDPAVSFIRSVANGKVEGIKTENNTLYSKKAIVVAAGCWTGSLMHKLIGDSDFRVNVPVQPRKGFLMQLQNFDSLKLNHALMEVGYTDHVTVSTKEAASPPNAVNQEHNSLSISMTAALDAKGHLLLGSSRQFAGFNTELDMQVINGIWERAGEFFPVLRKFPLADLAERRNVRVGLRPFMPDGKPVIGPIPGMPNVFIAAGHEGGGLAMAPGTAELVFDMVLDNPLKINLKPFAVEGRCC